MPHISELMVSSIDEVIDHAGTIVIGNDDPAFGPIAGHPRPGQRIVDLVRIVDSAQRWHGYDGICW